jgi:thymidylate kinase
LDVDPEIGFQRIGRKPHHAGKNRKKTANESPLISGTGTDAMEARPIEFHRRVRRIFQELPAYYPTPVIIVDASTDADTVYQRIWEGLSRVSV